MKKGGFSKRQLELLKGEIGSERDERTTADCNSVQKNMENMETFSSNRKAPPPQPSHQVEGDTSEDEPEERVAKGGPHPYSTTGSMMHDDW